MAGAPHHHTLEDGLAADRLGHARIVAGEQQGANAHPLHRFDRLARLRSHGVRDGAGPAEDLLARFGSEQQVFVRHMGP